MAVFNNILAGASGQTGGAAAGYEIERSLRFNSADSAYLNRTPSSAGNRKTWTWSGWVKRGKLGIDSIFGLSSASISPGLGTEYIRFTSSDTIDWFAFHNGSSWTGRLTTSQVFRDPSAWMHIVCVVDLQNATSTDRLKLYVNGSRVSAFSTAAYPNTTDSTAINAAQLHQIGRQSTGDYFDGYLADVHFIDGLALNPTDFGEFDDNNVWQPKAFNSFNNPNNGTTWSSDSSTTIGSAAFDGLTTTNYLTLSSDTITWTPSTGIPYTSLEFASSSGAGGGATDMRYSINGGAEVAFEGAGAATLVTASGTLTSLAIRNTTASNCRWDYVKVNGYMMVDGAGDNSFHLDFSDATSTTTIAEDSSGNGNDWTANNISVSAGAGNDSLFDSPTNANAASDTGAGGEVSGNYCTLNPLKKGSGLTLSNGNLDGSIPAGPPYSSLGTIGMSSGKWYAEYTYVGGSYSTVGIAKDSATIDNYPGYDANGWSYDSYAGKKIHNATQSTYGATFTTNDVIGIAFDADNGTLTFYKNNTSQGQAFSGLTSGPYFFASGVDNSQFSWNFGQRPFAYTAPTGYQPLTTALLDDPTIADGSTAMDVALYTGNGGTQSITGINHSPDLVWIKSRNIAYDHELYDVVRGTTKRLMSSYTGAEDVRSGVTAFNSDGFSLGNAVGANTNNDPLVAWTWDGGSSTVSNTDGSITSSVRANASAGFSIITYTGSSSGSTVGHGLNVAPEFIIGKRRDGASEWSCYHKSLGNNQAIILNTTAAAGSSSTWNSTTPTSTVVSLGAAYSVNYPSYTHVLYCWAPVEGYSAFGSYTGNGSTNGPFVYTGFRPAFVMIKNADASSDWSILDTARDPYNRAENYLLANSSGAEGSPGYFRDYLSNGFKIRDNGSGVNTNAQTYIYAAFAETPQKFARAR